jgi:lysozyme
MNIHELDSYNLGDAVKFNNKLNPAIWQGNTMKPAVRQQLLAIAEDVKEQTKAVLTSTTSKYTVKSGDTLSAIAKAQGTTLSQILKDNPKFTEVDKYKGGNMIWAGTTVNITANTNASSQSIANDVGWAVRTSSDVQYSKSSTDIIAERRMRDGYL